MDGMSSPGASFVLAQSPSTIEPRKEPVAQAPSDVSQLAAEIRKLNESHMNYRSDADRKITELVQKNNLLQQEFTNAMAQQRATQPNVTATNTGNDVDNLWNQFLNNTPPATQQATPGKDSKDLKPEDVKQVVLNTLQEAQVKSQQFNQNAEEIEKQLFSKFQQECPDLHNRTREVLALWKGAAEANPAMAANPVARYNWSINKARELYGNSTPNLGADTSARPQGGGTVQQRGKDKTFADLAATEQQKEEQRREELEKYVKGRKRQFGERTGFPYGDLE